MTAFFATMPMLMLIGFTMFLSSRFCFGMVVAMFIAVRVFILITMPVIATFGMVILMFIAVAMLVFIGMGVVLRCAFFCIPAKREICAASNGQQ